MILYYSNIRIGALRNHKLEKRRKLDRKNEIAVLLKESKSAEENRLI